MAPDDPSVNMALSWLGRHAPSQGVFWVCHVRAETAMTHQHAIADVLEDEDERPAT